MGANASADTKAGPRAQGPGRKWPAERQERRRPIVRELSIRYEDLSNVFNEGVSEALHEALKETLRGHNVNLASGGQESELLCYLIHSQERAGAGEAPRMVARKAQAVLEHWREVEESNVQPIVAVCTFDKELTGGEQWREAFAACARISVALPVMIHINRLAEAPGGGVAEAADIIRRTVASLPTQAISRQHSQVEPSANGYRVASHERDSAPQQSECRLTNDKESGRLQSLAEELALLEAREESVRADMEGCMRNLEAIAEHRRHLLQKAATQLSLHSLGAVPSSGGSKPLAARHPAHTSQDHDSRRGESSFSSFAGDS